VLRLDRREIVASRDNAPIQNQEIVFTRVEDHVLAAGTNTVSREGNEEIDCQMARDASSHEVGRNCCLKRGRGGFNLL